MSTNLLSVLLAHAYSNPSNARRAARNSGLEKFEIVHLNEGWQIVVPSPVNTSGDQLGGAPVADMVLPVFEADEIPAATVPAHKSFAVYGASRVAKPVGVVHAFLDANPGLSRKEAVFELVARGVNYHTARTQYQTWFARQRG